LVSKDIQKSIKGKLKYAFDILKMKKDTSTSIFR